jgi:hypothetical protein
MFHFRVRGRKCLQIPVHPSTHKKSSVLTHKRIISENNQSAFSLS